MSALIELAERCEKATGPDRELDAEIACHAPICQADYVLSANPSNRRGMVTRHFDSGGHGTFVCDTYTASLDAAMTLVPEGWRWVMRQALPNKSNPNERGYFARLETDDFEAVTWGKGSDLITNIVAGTDVAVWAATPALALCAAALRARAAQ